MESATKFKTCLINEISSKALDNQSRAAEKMKFFIKNFFSTEEFLNGKLHFLCSVGEAILKVSIGSEARLVVPEAKTILNTFLS